MFYDVDSLLFDTIDGACEFASNLSVQRRKPIDVVHGTMGYVLATYNCGVIVYDDRPYEFVG